MSRKIYIATFGCRTNQADSAAIVEDFAAAGYDETFQPEEADVVVVNSCTVTHRSDQQVRQLTRSLMRRNPDARVLVTGCYAQRAPEALARLKGLTGVVGNTRKADLVTIAETDPSGIDDRPRSTRLYLDDFEKVRAIRLVHGTPVGGRTRPFVKIQDGCDAKCSYCIIPSVRGPSRSVPPDQILEQVRRLVAEGFREIVLTGIHIGTYGMHLNPRYPLDRLLSDLVQVEGLGQIRLSSIEPMELSRRVIRLAASTDRLAPHFHICLQSGSDRILKRMLRPYDTGRFLSLVEPIREQLPLAAIGTDVIVGFPGETEEDHQATLELIERGPFTYLHVFPYSDRPGTTASSMIDKVSPAVIKRRAGELRRLGARKNRAFRRRCMTETLTLLTLTDSCDGRREALTGNYVPAQVPDSVPANTLCRGVAAREQRGALVFDDVEVPSNLNASPVSGYKVNP